MHIQLDFEIMDEYIVSARKYRPMSFDSVVGQQALTTTLKNAVKSGKLAHAYLFCGPRGVGKTTCARIFAKAINCEHPTADGEACNECESCKAFGEGRSYNIFELDAASNNSVENIKSLMDQTRIPPQVGRYKVFIIDEVHMLTKEAFNALLKTLEEPPSHIIFILATTEIDKIPDTVISRCQRYDFLPIDKKDIIKLLKKVAFKEDIEIDEESLDLIYQKSEGSARDSFSIFEQVVSNFNNEEIDITKTQNALGVVPDVILEEFLNLVKEGDKEKLVDFIDKIWEDGLVIETFLKDFSYYLKEQFRKSKDIKVNFLLDTI